MKLAYIAFDKSGRQSNGQIEAATSAEARETLRREGLFVTEMHAHSGDSGNAATTAWSIPGGRGRRLAHVVNMTRQLYVLLKSGTALVQALAALERQASDPAWRVTLSSLRTAVEEGASLSSAMAEHPRYFDPVCRSLVSAGESSGKMEEMLERLATLVRKQVQVRSAIRGAMIYPCLLISVATAVLIVLMTFVMPRFTGMFDTLGAPLPPTTKLVVAISNAMIHYWYAWIVGLVLSVGGSWLWLRSAAGRRAFDVASVRLPVVGKIVTNFATARIARLLGVQLQGHVPLLEALNLTRSATGNTLYAELVRQAEDAATRGQPISITFAQSALMPPTICEAMRSGEATGQMASLLLSIADFLDEENELTVKSLTSILEPVILIVLGIVVGFVAISMFLPMFDLAGMAGGGGP
jgi:type II secretory pathway component PulF